MTEPIEALLRLAEESIDAAEMLLQGGHFRFSVARSYYTMFYCAQALHYHQGRSYSRHRGVISGFGAHFVKAGLFDNKFHEYLREAFDDRHRGDYEATKEVSEETARAALERSREFLEAAKVFLTREESP